MNDLQIALLYLITKDRMYSVEVALAQYLISTQEIYSSKQIKEYFGWSRQNTSRALLRLLSKKIILVVGGGYVINENWREWANGKVAHMRQSVQNQKFSELITENLLLRLKKYSLSKGLHLEDADDVVSTALLKAQKKFYQFNGGSFEGWMIQILKNTIHDFWKKERENRMFDDEISSIASNEALTELLELKSNISQVKECLNLLPQEERDLLELWSAKDMIPYSQASIILGIPEGTVKSRIHRAKEHLKELLNNKSI